ncbi:anti-sigma factor [Metabacillus sp. cB07]|uniref:anti-sigma factor n=1 Tax=Metabacillus sp. cB07 TaxID=2806989 RepID=UPI001939F185|nr:anti-sigma factor [Metabacillus sp. cB07]
MSSQMCEKLYDYFSENLTPAEKAEFEAHLKSCPDCSEEFQELTSLTEDLPYLSVPVQPPKEMKQRILGNVFESDTPLEMKDEKIEPTKETVTPIGIKSEKRPKRFVLPSVAALLFASLLGNAYFVTQMENEAPQEKAFSMDDLKKQVALAPVDDQLSETTAMAALMEKDSKEMVFLQAEQLKQLNDGEVYQVWLIENDKPVAAGSFVPDSSGHGAVMYEMNLEGGFNWDTIAITIEPKAGNKAPEGAVVLASQL